MSDPILPALLVAAVALVVIGWLCLRLARVHRAAAAHCRCISQMLAWPEDAHDIADANRQDLIRRGLWLDV